MYCKFILIEGMLSIYLKVTIDQNWHSQTFIFPSLKDSSPDQFLERRTLSFSPYKNCELKINCSWNKKECMFTLSEGNNFDICFLSRCIVYWTNFENVYTFTFLLILKIVKLLQLILKWVSEKTRIFHSS